MLELLAGPLGGVLGGAASFILLEIGVRHARLRHSIAEALAAELTNNADDIRAILDSRDPDEIPPNFRTSSVVFAALVGQLGALPYEDVLAVTKLYGYLDQANAVPAAWRQRALDSYRLPINHPAMEGERKAVRKGAEAFYGMVQALVNDCDGLAGHLRTKFALGWYGLVPLRWRPTVKSRIGDDGPAAA